MWQDTFVGEITKIRSDYIYLAVLDGYLRDYGQYGQRDFSLTLALCWINVLFVGLTWRKINEDVSGFLCTFYQHSSGLARMCLRCSALTKWLGFVFITKELITYAYIVDQSQKGCGDSQIGMFYLIKWRAQYTFYVSLLWRNSYLFLWSSAGCVDRFHTLFSYKS